jgi:hypothetical protein
MPNTSLIHDEARLTREQAARIQAHLEAIVAEMRTADDKPDTTGDTHPYILTALFHTMADPSPNGDSGDPSPS